MVKSTLMSTYEAIYSEKKSGGVDAPLSQKVLTSLLFSVDESLYRSEGLFDTHVDYNSS